MCRYCSKYNAITEQNKMKQLRLCKQKSITLWAIYKHKTIKRCTATVIAMIDCAWWLFALHMGCTYMYYAHYNIYNPPTICSVNSLITYDITPQAQQYLSNYKNSREPNFEVPGGDNYSWKNNTRFTRDTHYMYVIYSAHTRAQTLNAPRLRHCTEGRYFLACGTTLSLCKAI